MHSDSEQIADKLKQLTPFCDCSFMASNSGTLNTLINRSVDAATVLVLVSTEYHLASKLYLRLLLLADILHGPLRVSVGQPLGKRPHLQAAN